MYFLYFRDLFVNTTQHRGFAVNTENIIFRAVAKPKVDGHLPASLFPLNFHLFFYFVPFHFLCLLIFMFFNFLKTLCQSVV